MKFKEHLAEVDSKDFTIEEKKDGETLLGYSVTYKFAGRSLTEDVNVAGLSKKSTKKKLEDLKAKLKTNVRYVRENTMVNPGTDILVNDYGRRIFPYTFTTDCTTLSPKEVLDAVLTVSLADPVFIKTFINQAEDDLATVEKLGQENRAADLKIRIAIAKNALERSAKNGDIKKD